MPGIYVAAGEDHRFTDVTDDLAAIVLFAPAEGTGGPMLARES